MSFLITIKMLRVARRWPVDCHRSRRKNTSPAGIGCAVEGVYTRRRRIIAVLVSFKKCGTFMRWFGEAQNTWCRNRAAERGQWL